VIKNSLSRLENNHIRSPFLGTRTISPKTHDLHHMLLMVIIPVNYETLWQGGINLLRSWSKIPYCLFIVHVVQSFSKQLPS
jgi:hypothetical protein